MRRCLVVVKHASFAFKPSTIDYDSRVDTGIRLASPTVTAAA